MATVPICDFKLVHMCWEQLPVGEWADCVLIVCPRTEQDAVRTLLVLKKKGCSQEEKEWMAKPPAAKGG